VACGEGVLILREFSTAEEAERVFDSIARSTIERNK
jgi:hypothetical protein